MLSITTFKRYENIIFFIQWKKKYLINQFHDFNRLKEAKAKRVPNSIFFSREKIFPFQHFFEDKIVPSWAPFVSHKSKKRDKKETFEQATISFELTLHYWFGFFLMIWFYSILLLLLHLLWLGRKFFSSTKCDHIRWQVVSFFLVKQPTWKPIAAKMVNKWLCYKFSNPECN